MKELIDSKGRVTFKAIKTNEFYFKLCNKCGSFNYVQNTTCITCNKKEHLDDSSRNDINTFKEIEKEYDFYKAQGFSIKDIDEIKLTVK